MIYSIVGEAPTEGPQTTDEVCEPVEAEVCEPVEAEKWVPHQQTIEGVPQGMQYLSKVEAPVIKRLYGELPDEVVVPYEITGAYKIMNKFGKRSVYYAFEEVGGCCKPSCSRRGRRFQYHITTRSGDDVFILERPCPCCQGCMCCFDCSCSNDVLRVSDGNGKMLGTVVNKCGVCKPRYRILNSEKELLYELVGQCTFLKCGECKPSKDFKIKTVAKGSDAMNRQLGTISKQFLAADQSNSSDEDSRVFGLSLPGDMDVRMKAVLIGASFLLNVMYYDSSTPNQKTLNRVELFRYFQNYGDDECHEKETELWVPKMRNIPGLPKGLQYLKQMNVLIFERSYDGIPCGMILPYTPSRNFKISNKHGQQVYYGFERVEGCCKHCTGRQRSFTYHIINRRGDTVFTFTRPSKCYCCQGCTNCFCCNGCCCCRGKCRDRVDVVSNNGEMLGRVINERNICRPRYIIQDSHHETRIEVVGRYSACRCCCCYKKKKFKMKTLSTKDKAPRMIGTISTDRMARCDASGVIREQVMVGIAFPTDMNIRIKAVVVAACFLVYTMHYEKTEHVKPPKSVLEMVEECPYEQEEEGNVNAYEPPPVIPLPEERKPTPTEEPKPTLAPLLNATSPQEPKETSASVPKKKKKKKKPIAIKEPAPRSIPSQEPKPMSIAAPNPKPTAQEPKPVLKQKLAQTAQSISAPEPKSISKQGPIPPPMPVSTAGPKRRVRSRKRPISTNVDTQSSIAETRISVSKPGICTIF